MKIFFRIAIAILACMTAASAFAQDGRVSLGANPNPAAVGQDVLIAAFINWEDVKPTGTITYLDGGAAIPGCEGLPMEANGDPQSCTHAFTTAGTHVLTATYSGDSRYPAGSSPPVNEVINEGKLTPVITVNGSPAFAGPGEFPTLTTQVSSTFNGPPDSAASGTVTLFDGQVQLRDCTDVPVVNGVAQCHAPFSLGTHPITAQYSGDARYNPGTSGVFGQYSFGRKTLVDFNGDNKGDLLFANRNDNSVQIWLQDGLDTTAMPMVTGASTLTSLWKAGDFNGDGTTDLLQQTSDGAATIYLLSNGSVATQVQVRAPGSGWHVTHVADFNNDGRADILWRNDDGRADMWLMDGTNIVQQGTIMPAGTAWRVALTGDFDGDGRADLVWVNEADRSVGVWIMDGLTTLDHRTIMPANSGWAPSFIADFNDDGKTDIIWTNRDGSVGLWLMQGTQVGQRTSLMGPGTGWSVTQVSDLSNEIFWKNAAGNVGAWITSDGTSFNHFALQGAGSPWTVTAVQDVDGDQHTDFLWTDGAGSVGLWRMIGLSQVSRRTLLPDGSPWQLLNAQIAPNAP